MSSEESADERQRRLRLAGNWLRGQREQRGWTGSDLARKLDVNQVRVSAYERGQYEVPGQVADEIANAFDIPVIDVRRELGLWVPRDEDLVELRHHADPGRMSDDALVGELVRRYQARTDREIAEVYPRRSNVPHELWERLINSAKSDICLGGYTNYFFWTEQPTFGETLRRKAKSGARIRILVGDPDSDVTRRRERVENATLGLTTRINITLDEVTTLGADSGIEVRLSDANAEAHVSRSVFRFDREALVCEHIADRLGHGSLTYHIRRLHDDGPFDQYVAHFEHLWDGGKDWPVR